MIYRNDFGAKKMSLIEKIHSNFIFGGRVRVLSERLSQLLPPESSVLDVGCGDGTIARLMMEKRPDVQIKGIDVLVRPTAKISVTEFDGTNIPFESNSFDLVMFIDVLHHTENPLILLREAVRVVRIGVVIKDHLCENRIDDLTLRLMDYVGNAHHGVALPYNYWSYEKWKSGFEELNLSVKEWQAKLNLYPIPAKWLFSRSLHFIARLDLT